MKGCDQRYGYELGECQTVIDAFFGFFFMFLFEIDGMLKTLLVYEKVGDLV